MHHSTLKERFLKRHELTHEEPQLNCPVCGRKFFQKNLLESHKKVHEVDRGFTHYFGCCECDKVYARRHEQPDPCCEENFADVT